MRRWYAVGLVKQKPFANRPHDSIAFAFGRAVFNSRSRDVQEAAASTPEQAAMQVRHLLLIAILALTAACSSTRSR